MGPSDRQELLEEQKAYYEARAREYDDWFLRRDRYDRGPERNRKWFSEVSVLRQALRSFRPAGNVLELASGTGLWSEQLLADADRLTAVDASEECRSICRRRLGDDSRVRYVQADLFDWTPSESYDIVFFSFWLSHVPAERFDDFWALVASALGPAGRVFFIDSLRTATATATDQALSMPDDSICTRRLKDGREFQIVKIFHDPASLARRLESLGWQASVEPTGEFFFYGSAARSATTHGL
jgi:SAM-dependent methyltransferase